MPRSARPRPQAGPRASAGPRPNARPARRGTRSAALLTVLAAVATALAACSPPGQPGPHDPTYAELGSRALHTLEHGYYDGAGEWNVCVPHICGTGNVDWGVDSLTYALYFSTSPRIPRRSPPAVGSPVWLPLTPVTRRAAERGPAVVDLWSGQPAGSLPKAGAA